jgi:predicted protein tyrosine phosphatase
MARHFLILGRESVEKYQLQRPHVVISVRDPGSEKAMLPGEMTRLDALFLEFDDLDGPYPSEKIILFNKGHAAMILGFFEKWKDRVDTFVINCEAGISRSAGIGAALCKICGYDDSRFFKQFCPNRLVYRTILEGRYGGYDESTRTE